jgi:hypothetical protein
VGERVVDLVSAARCPSHLPAAESARLSREDRARIRREAETALADEVAHVEYPDAVLALLADADRVDDLEEEVATLRVGFDPVVESWRAKVAALETRVRELEEALAAVRLRPLTGGSVSGPVRSREVPLG